MELVPVIRILWRRRWRIGAGALAAIVAAVTVGGGPARTTGYAKAEVVVDTPRSTVVAAAPAGMNTLYWRAQVLGLSLGTDAARRQMAHKLGVPIGQIGVTNTTLTAPAVPAALPVAAIQAAATPTNYGVSITPDNLLPVLQVEATAPDKAAAARLALVAVQLLQDGTSPRTTPAVQGLAIRLAGPVQARAVPAGASRKTMVETAVGVLSLWCLLGAVVGSARRRFRHVTWRPAAR